MLEPLSTYVDAARRQLPGEFVMQFPDALLLIDPFEPVEETGFRTNAAAASAGGFVSTVGRVKKREGSNAFASMITVGRAPNNDIKIPSTTVSKFHCYFMVTAAGTTISDAGSTNGTFIKGRRLEPRSERVTLESKDEIRLGDLRMVYLTSRHAWERLRDGATPSGRALAAGRSPLGDDLTPRAAGPNGGLPDASVSENMPTKRLKRPGTP